MSENEFAVAFEALSGNPPFPWQWELYRQFLLGSFPPSCSLPTGLGKTSVIHIWVLALAHAPDKVPRRLVYVVNRRTVVDQSTDEARKLRGRLVGDFGPPTMVQSRIAAKLAELSTGPNGIPLAISTLRGQFADNREWSSDPSRPAVIAGTVDMIGSRLLFSGYGCGFKSRPLHAGFLGQDALVVHDEAHLEPAFQKLISDIEREQREGRTPDFRPLRVMELTATSRAEGQPSFGLSKNDHDNTVVNQRIHAKKGITFHSVKFEKGATAARIGDLAVGYLNSQQAILVFVRTIDDVNVVAKKIAATGAKYELLTGTIRGKERDDLVNKPVFRRFRPGEQEGAASGTVYLICTSAGEVGIDISADHLVCDLTPFDSLAQRFGRVNRRGGDDKKAKIAIVYETNPDPKKLDDLFEKARWETLKLLRDHLPACDWDANRQDASPTSLGDVMAKLSEEQRIAVFTPQPTILATTDILFDSWALTTIRGKLPGRPPVEPYLHGISGWEPPETHVAWREEVWELRLKLSEEERKQREAEERKRLARFAADLLEDYPLKPHELLRDNSSRVFDRLKKLKAPTDTQVWIVSEDDTVEVTTLAELTAAGKERIERKTVLLPPLAGGLNNGMLTDNPAPANDVADELFDENRKLRRLRVWDDDKDYEDKTEDMRMVRRIDLPASGEGEDVEGRSWHWFELPKDGDTDGSKSNKKPVLWCVHTEDVTKNATAYIAKLPLPQELKDAILLAAKWHDLGKRRKLFQTILGNFKYPASLLAKSGKRGGRIAEVYRHEFGSLIDVLDEKQSYYHELCKLPADMRDVVLHLIAVHHGYGRPHFPADRAFDPEPKGQKVDEIAAAVTQRFARLQRRYGRWGLAYLESLLRAADYAASAKPSTFVEDW